MRSHLPTGFGYHRSDVIKEYPGIEMNDSCSIFVTMIDRGRPFVYFLFDAGGELLYVGKTINLLARLGTHLSDSRRSRIISGFASIACETSEEMNDLEIQSIKRFRPTWNIARKDVHHG